MNREIYTRLCALLEAGAPSLRWIAWDEGQLSIYNERPPLAYPCCLVDIQYTGCKDLDGVNQLVTAAIILRLVFQPPGESAARTPAKVRDRALEIFDRVEEVHEALQGSTLEDTVTELARRRAVKAVRKDGLIVFTLTYETTFEEMDGE
jgi:hypothetical protein